MKKNYAIINLVVILAVIIWNYWTTTGAVNGNTVSSLSDEYQNLFTPAGYAFSIWGLIFLGLIVLGITQIRMAFFGGHYSETILQMGPWLTVANLGNATWLWIWLHEETGISVLIMIVILFSLLQILVQLKIGKWDAPFSLVVTVWWPVAIYCGWITVATIANISAWLAKIEWLMVFTEVQWTIIMISIAALLNMFMVYSRNLYAFSAVAVWAFIAISVRHWGVFPLIQWWSLLWSIILIAVILIQLFKKRKSNPATRQSPDIS